MNTINNNLFVSKKSSIIFKGLSALVIMLGHYLPDNCPIILKILINGTLCVGIFFFYSGYGLSYNLEKKDYLNHFIIKKVKKFGYHIV